MPALWAVHISDNVLAVEWWAGGLVLAALLAALGAWRMRDDEVPRVALLSAAFFIASSLHIKIGPGSVHLLLNGLLGVVLGPRALLAIPVGLLLQYLLLQHGGFYTLGVNACVMALPALGGWLLFGSLRRLTFLRRPWCRSLLVGLCAAVWMLSLLYSVTLLVTNTPGTAEKLDPAAASAVTFHPLTLALVAVASLAAAWGERRLDNGPDFPLGLALGEMTVLATLGLNCLVLLAGGERVWLTTALLLVAAHMPLALVEGIIVGFTVAFLARVKPELLGGPMPAPPPAENHDTHATAIHSLPSANGCDGDARADARGAGAQARR